MGLLISIIFLLCIPFVAIYCYAKQNKNESEKRSQHNAELRDRIARQQRIEEIARREAAQKGAELAHFHRNVFPVVAASDDIQSAWSVWPLKLHDEAHKIDRQKRSLYNTVPVLIDSCEMSALFYPSDDSETYTVYNTTLQFCTCPDFDRYGGPCKHNYRLFYELTHTPYGNPSIVDVDPLISSAMSSFDSSTQYVFFFWLFHHEFDLRQLHPISPAFISFIERGLLIESNDISPMDYEPLLNSMTKDQIILALAKRHISGFYSSWPKYKLISWIIENHPQFLKRQFSNYINASLNPSISGWVDGVYLSKHSQRVYVPDSELEDSYSLYK